MNLGGIPPNVGNLFNIASYLQGQQSLPGSGLGSQQLLDPNNFVYSQQPLGAPAALSPLGPNTVTSSAYGMIGKNLQSLSTLPQQTLNQIGPLDELNPFGNQKFFPGSFEADQMMMEGINLGQQQLPENEFDQAQQTVTQAKKAANMFARGRDAVQYARNVKKAADIANASSDVGSLLGNLGAQGAGEAAKQTAKTGVGQFIANAGASKMGTFLSSGAGAATSAGVGLLGKYIQERDKKDGNYSKAGAMGGGALQGAAIGSALGPIGTVVGAGVGAAVGAAQKKKFDKQALYQEKVDSANENADEASQKLSSRAILNIFPVRGIKEQVYALGGEPGLEGEIPKKPEAIAGAMPTALELAAAQQLNRMVDPLTGSMMKENHPLAAEYIDNDLMNIGQRTWLNSQTESNPNLRPAWSAGAVSNLMQAAYPGFKNSTAHAGYMQDVLFGDNKANFKGDRTSLKTSFEPGTVLTQGRGANSNMNYRQMKKTVEQYDPNKSTPMHGDVIIGSYVNDAGKTMYQIQGGNMADTLYTKDLSAKEIRNKYPMALMPPKMKHGGHTNNPDYLAEGGEMIQHAFGDLPKTDGNGSVTPVTNTIARINGDKHTAPSGGVGMEGNKSARIYSDQLYVPAELVAQLSKL